MYPIPKYWRAFLYTVLFYWFSWVFNELKKCLPIIYMICMPVLVNHKWWAYESSSVVYWNVLPCNPAQPQQRGPCSVLPAALLPADSLPGVLWRWGVCVRVRACLLAHIVQGASVTMCLKKKKSFIKQLYNKFLEVLIYNYSTKAHSCIPF